MVFVPTPTQPPHPPSSEKGTTLKGKFHFFFSFSVDPFKGSKLFPLRVDPFPEGFGVQESKQAVKSFTSPWRKLRQIYRVSCPK